MVSHRKNDSKSKNKNQRHINKCINNNFSEKNRYIFERTLKDFGTEKNKERALAIPRRSISPTPPGNITTQKIYFTAR
jgi:hypothetical protein